MHSTNVSELRLAKWVVSHYSKFKCHGPKLGDSVHHTPDLFLMIDMESS